MDNSDSSVVEEMVNDYYIFKKQTLFSELETIEIALQIVNLINILHQENLVHTNLNPLNIFLQQKDINKMSFLNLYHC